jgi:carboxylesterase type B
VDRPWTETDKKLAELMSSYWTNFAATGNPNGQVLPKWPAFDKATNLSLELGDTVRPTAIRDRTKLEEFNKNRFSLVF